MSDTRQTYTDLGPLLALSVQQPWAWLIVNGWKDVENRSWPTSVRDRVLIHAGQKFDRHGYRWLTTSADSPIINRPDFPVWPQTNAFQRGGIVGVARIVDCVKASKSPWYFGPYGFVMIEAKPLPFAPCRGALKWFLPQP